MMKTLDCSVEALGHGTLLCKKVDFDVTFVILDRLNKSEQK